MEYIKTSPFSPYVFAVARNAYLVLANDSAVISLTKLDMEEITSLLITDTFVYATGPKTFSDGVTRTILNVHCPLESPLAPYQGCPLQLPVL